MQFSKFTPAIALAILAYKVQAAPYWGQNGHHTSQGAEDYDDDYATEMGSEIDYATEVDTSTTTYTHPPSSHTTAATTYVDTTYVDTTTYVDNTNTYPPVPSSTNESVPPVASSTTAPPPPALPTGLSKTAQLLLADTRADGINNVLKDDKDFLFDFNLGRQTTPTNGEGGQIVAANRKTFPALTNQGIGMAVGFIGPCGFNTPHIHNRATELLIVTKGRVISEMVIENTVNNADGKPRDIRNELGPYQMMPFYQGSIHSQFNPDCEDVIFVAPQSNEDFGVSQVAQNFLALDGETVRATFDNFFDGAYIEEFKGKVSKNVALGVEECLNKCKIPKRR